MLYSENCEKLPNPLFLSKRFAKINEVAFSCVCREDFLDLVKYALKGYLYVGNISIYLTNYDKIIKIDLIFKWI